MNLPLDTFFSESFVDYASYDNLRKIASCIDGQKNASRKVLYTVLEKNIRDRIKVSQLGSKVAEFAEYLHGSLDGVVVNLAQDFSGTNNLPLLQKKGNFGTRFAPEASASRYIFTYGSDMFFKLFKAEDSAILEQQMFEGEKIEPKFYVPTLPMILINGSEGVSSGFAQKILCRNVTTVAKNVGKYLTKGEKAKFLPMPPYFNGFRGVVAQGDSPTQWLIKGVISRVSQNKVRIDEIPVGYDLKGYISVLDKLEETKVIQSYEDLSNETFTFVVTFPRGSLKDKTDDQILQDLKLVKKVTENYTCTDENNKIKVFETVEDILKHYVKIKLQYLQKRKDYVVEILKKDILILKNKIRFIQSIIDETLVISKRKQSDVVTDLDAMAFDRIEGSFDYLLNMRICSLTEDLMQKLQHEAETKEQNLSAYTQMSTVDIWLSDIKEL